MAGTLRDFREEIEGIRDGHLPPELELLRMKAKRLGKNHPDVLALQKQYADSLRRRYGNAMIEIIHQNKTAAVKVLTDALKDKKS